MPASLRLSLSLALLLLLASLALGGCNRVDKWLGCSMTTTVDAADLDSPEGVVLEAIKAAMEKDEAAGWLRFRDLLHSRQLISQASEKNWRQLNFQTFRRKLPLYLEDDTIPVYRQCFQEEHHHDVVKVFLQNEKSEMPTPCTVRKDPEANGAYRIDLCSL